MVPMRLITLSSCVLLLLSLQDGASANSASDAKEFWPQWRGPLATGEAPLADPPLTWSETDHIKWKVKIPGAGDSTPIVWGDRVFILTAIPVGKKSAAKAPVTTTAPSANPASNEARSPRGRMNRSEERRVGT